MKIIGLFGKANQGKTATLNQVIQKLEEQGGKIMVSELGGNDRRVCIDYKGKKICIATGGDNSAAVQKNCNFFTSHNPDIAVSATRTKGETRTALNQYARTLNIKVVWIEKYGSTEKTVRAELNNINAYLVLKHIFDKSIKIKQSFEFEIS